MKPELSVQCAARLRNRCIFMLAAVLTLTSPTLAASDTDFYRGKSVKFVVSAGAGGGYGLLSQLLAQHMPKYIPGAPAFVLEYMPGAGGVAAANYLYNAAPKDGTAIGMLRATAPIDQILRPSGIKYDASKLTWIGRMTPENSTLGVWHQAPATTLEEAKNRQIVVGVTGTSGTGYIFSTIFKKLTGAQFKIVTGYRGTNDVVTAMERGEAHAAQVDWQIWNARWGNLLKENKIRHFYQTGAERIEALPDVPTVIDVARNDEERTIAQLLSIVAVIGKSISGPPGIPGDRVEMLRNAFTSAIRDPELLASAKSRGIAIDTRSGADLAVLVTDALKTPKSTIDQMKRLLEQ